MEANINIFCYDRGKTSKLYNSLNLQLKIQVLKVFYQKISINKESNTKRNIALIRKLFLIFNYIWKWNNVNPMKMFGQAATLLQSCRLG